MKVLSVFGQVGIGLLVGTFFSLAALVDVSYGAEVAYKFTTVDIPLHFTFLGQERNDIVRLTDINNNGEMVGNDFAGDGFFVNTNHMATEIRCPGDQTDNDSTTVSAINNAGDVVGSCSAGGTRAFVRNRNGIITLLNFPGADGTIGLGINDLGHVVGQYWGFAFGTGLDRFHGFVWKDGMYTTIDAPFPDAMTTGLLGINNAGQIIGTYLHHRPGSTQINDYDSEVAFLYDNGTFTLLDFPGAKLPYLCCGATTFPMDINNRGQVIGSTYDSDGKPQFFLYHKGTYLVVTGIPQGVLDAYDFSVIHGNTAWGINDQGVLAGTYVQRVPCETCGPHGEPDDRFEVHSFIATPIPTPPTLTIAATPDTLWPPNGKMIPVTITGAITDAGSDLDPSTATYAVTDEYGNVQPSAPFTVGLDSSYAVTIKLQASRNGNDKDGRQYIITVSAKDYAGNIGSAATSVTVPHDQGH